MGDMVRGRTGDGKREQERENRRGGETYRRLRETRVTTTRICKVTDFTKGNLTLVRSLFKFGG